MIRLLLALFALLPTAVAATPTRYYCEVTKIVPDHPGTGWFPRNALYVIDPQAGSATALDSVIDFIHEKPLLAELKSDKGAYQLKWRVKGVPITHTRNLEGLYVARTETTTTLRFTLRLDPATKTFSLRSMSGALGAPRASGTCRTR